MTGLQDDGCYRNQQCSAALHSDTTCVLHAAADAIIGKGGAVLIVIICFMAVTSSGAGELMAVSSLMTFDGYREYIHPKVGGCWGPCTLW